MKKSNKQSLNNKVIEEKYVCTECNGDATVAFIPSEIKRGKLKGTQIPSWGGKILPGERVCYKCGLKRGLRFF